MTGRLLLLFVLAVGGAAPARAVDTWSYYPIIPDQGWWDSYTGQVLGGIWGPCTCNTISGATSAIDGTCRYEAGRETGDGLHRAYWLAPVGWSWEFLDFDQDNVTNDLDEVWCDASVGGTQSVNEDQIAAVIIIAIHLIMFAAGLRSGCLIQGRGNE